MTNTAARTIRRQSRFNGIERSENVTALQTSVLHGDGMQYLKPLFESENGRQTTSGETVFRLEQEVAEYIGEESAVAVSSGTAAMHLAVKLAAEKLFGSISGENASDGAGNSGCLKGRKVFCPDFCSAESVNPVVYEGGEPIFIDASFEDWGMDPEALALAFDRYPDVKLVIYAHVYGFPGAIDQIKKICEEHGALLIEDASDALGASYQGKKTGSFGDYGVLSFDVNKIVTGFGGGALLTHDKYGAERARSWANGSKANALWRQHEELGYHYAMSNVTAGMILGQFQYLDEHIAAKKRIFERYMESFDEDLLLMNPVIDGAAPNYWMPCILCESSIQFDETRSERGYTYNSMHGTASPMEIYDCLQAFGIESMPVWKPMHMQPLFGKCDQISVDGSIRSYPDFCRDDFFIRANESKELFEEGLCLPCGIGMTEEEQEQVIEIVRRCFD